MEDLIKTILGKVNDEIEAEITKAIAVQINSAIDEVVDKLDELRIVFCDECGDNFHPVKSIRKYRKCLCWKHAGSLTTDKDTEPEIEESRVLDYSPEASAKRSDSQQHRRKREKAELTKHECAFCGKLTNKLFCSDKCRKLHEKLTSESDIPEQYTNEHFIDKNSAINPEDARLSESEITSKHRTDEKEIPINRSPYVGGKKIA